MLVDWDVFVDDSLTMVDEGVVFLMRCLHENFVVDIDSPLSHRLCVVFLIELVLNVFVEYAVAMHLHLLSFAKSACRREKNLVFVL
jgi:hypothetical protein